MPSERREEVDGRRKCRKQKHTDKKENQNFPIYKEIHNRAVAKSYTTNGLLIQYMGKYFPISSYIGKPFLTYDFATAPL
jgi:hypothetical protein